EAKGLSRDDVSEKAQVLVKKAQLLAQLDSALEAMHSKVADALFFNVKGASGGWKSKLRTAQAEMPKLPETPWSSEVEAMSDFTKTGTKASLSTLPASMGISSGEVIPVSVVAIKEGLTIGVSGGSTGIPQIGPSQVSVGKDPYFEEMNKVFEANRRELKSLLNKGATGEKPSFTDYGKVMTASSLSGGGGYGNVEFKGDIFTRAQIDKIKELMTTKSDISEVNKALANIGTGIHLKLQKELLKKPGVSVEEPVKFDATPYGAGIVTGLVDVVERGSEGGVKKVIDIKTTGEKHINNIKKAIEKSGGSVNYKDIIDNLSDEARNKIEEGASQLNLYLKALDESATGELHFYSREGEGTSEKTVVKVGFSESRLKRDLESVTKAREEIIAGGGKFRAAVSPESLRGTDVKAYTEEDINTIIKNATVEYQRLKKGTGNVGGMGSKGKNVDDATKVLKSIEFAKELNKYMIPPEIAKGSGIDTLYRNIKAFHDQAKLYQEDIGISFKEIYERLPKTVSLEIEKAAISGPDYTTFIRQLDIFKNNPEALSGGDTIKSWKLYRMAVGDFLMTQADQAEKNLASAVVGGDSNEEIKAYNTFKRSINRMQEFVKRGAGKRTDIYTEDNRFVYPGLAESAGVYMPSREIMKRSSTPLEEDQDLMKVYDNLISDISSGDTLTSPLVKAREALEEITNMDYKLVDLINDAEIVKQLGPEIQQAWDFTNVSTKIS
ncbi:MAG: hypothetical protein JJV88_04390, partial [Sulfurovum sp.]|nr:hypothetical protein [Sulfurovaceae bacterium]